MDAGARGRRLLQRREYRAKVSEFIPKELEDQFNYDKNGHLVFEIDFKELGSKIKRNIKKFIDKPIMKDYPNQKQYQDSIKQGTSNQFSSYEPEGEMIDEEGKSLFSTPGLDKLKKIKDFKDNADKVFGRKPIEKAHYEPEGEMIEANSAQMKAMHDAQMKKKEDDKVAAKKKDMKEGSAYGITRGSGKPSGAFKDFLDKKKKKEKKKVDEACWKGYEKKGMKTMFGKRYPNCVKKTKKEEVELEAKKSCGEGEYYCYDEQKCKPIPDGMKVGKDGMLVKEDMKGMSQKSGDKRSTESGAGMTAQGVAKYNRRTGGNLKTAVTTPPSKLKPGSKAAKRRKSFCARSRSWTGPRGKAARRRWNCSYEPELPMIIDEKKKLYNTAPLSDRVSNWSKKINEGMTPGRNDYGLPTGLKSNNKTTKTKKVDPKNLPVAMASYEPQGEMIERKMTSSEKDKKEKYVKGMKKVKGDFTKRYGKDGKSVMYATATKMAMKKEAYGDVPFRDGRVKKYLGKDNIDNIKLTQKGKQAFRTIPDPKIFSGNKAINPDNPITKMYRSLDRVNMSYEPEGEMIEDFYKKKYDVRKGGYQKTDKMTKSNKRSGDSKAQHRELHKDLAKYKIKKLKTEGSLHSWFKGSKSKDGKPGWVNVVTGGTCASDKPGEGTPKCVSSSKRASMTKAERLSASRRKKKADPGQQSKSGAAKPTYVATDKKKKKVDEMNQGPSTPVGNYDGKIMPKFGAGRIGNVRLKGGKTIADLLKKV